MFQEYFLRLRGKKGQAVQGILGISSPWSLGGEQLEAQGDEAGEGSQNLPILEVRKLL